MKPISLLVLLNIFLFGTLCAQDDDSLSAEELMFKEAATHFENGDYLGAAALFDQFMKQYTQSPLLARAHFNMGLSYYMFRDYGTSGKIFNEILDQPYNERDANDLMEPYALYKHHCCRYLADIALEEKDYESAEKYIRLFDKKYPYQHFCGNEWSAYDMYKAVMYAKVYEGTNQVKKAIDELLPYVFTTSLASNEEVLFALEDMLDKHYSRDNTKAEFNQALASLEVKRAKKVTTGTIVLYGVKVEIEDFFFDEDDKSATDTEHYRQIVMDNALFKKYL